MSENSNSSIGKQDAQQEIDQLREELRKALADAASAREELRSKLHELAREFRVPLTSVLGFSDVLGTKNKSSELNQIAKAGHQLMNLVTNLEQPGLARNPVENQTHQDTPTSFAPATNVVLHIEDDEPNFHLVETILQSQPNIEVLWATTGALGFEMASQNVPALILLDLNLPDVHGSELLARLKNNPTTAKIPVIVVSADATPSQIERMLQAGAHNYLIKPFDINRLLYLVNEALAPARQSAARDMRDAGIEPATPCV